MSQKRKHGASASDTPSSEPPHHSKPFNAKRQKPSHNHDPSSHHAHAHPYAHNKLLPKKSNPINPLKSRIRSLNRLLSTDDHASSSASQAVQSHEPGRARKKLGADVRLARQRELKSLQYELAIAERAERRKAAITKWHMVRFFDRKKAERRLKKVEKELVEAETESAGERRNEESLEEIRSRVRVARIDLKYTLFCPLELPYASLWPGKGREGSRSRSGQQGGTDKGGQGAEVTAGTETGEQVDADVSKGDGRMWRLVEKCMDEGRLEQLRSGEAPELKNDVGRPQEESGTVQEVSTAAGKSARRDKETRRSKAIVQNTQIDEGEDENESDGGFFD